MTVSAALSASRSCLSPGCVLTRESCERSTSCDREASMPKPAPFAGLGTGKTVEVDCFLLFGSNARIAIVSGLQSRHTRTRRCAGPCPVVHFVAGPRSHCRRRVEWRPRLRFRLPRHRWSIAGPTPFAPPPEEVVVGRGQIRDHQVPGDRCADLRSYSLRRGSDQTEFTFAESSVEFAQFSTSRSHEDGHRHCLTVGCRHKGRV